MFGASQHTP
ncbi:hypothetical protein A2U01_0085016, partial [Trifolium medium]|nr:hypothetical protein [Trifolium medium]